MKSAIVMILAAAWVQGASPDLKHLNLAAPNTATELNNRGVEYYLAARYQDAENMYRLSLKAWAQRGNDTIPDIAFTMGNLGGLLRATGRYSEAKPLLLEALHRLEAAGEGE